MHSITSNSRKSGPRQRILAAAEELFAERGIDAVRLEQVAAQAQVDLDKVLEHFEDKRALSLELLRTLSRRVSRLGLRRLAQILETSRDAASPPPLEEVIDSILVAYLSRRSGLLLSQLILERRLHPSPWSDAAIQDELDGLARAYQDALSQAAPWLSPAQISWRYTLMGGAVQTALTEARPHSRLARLSDGRCDPTDMAELRRELRAFLIAAFREPPKRIAPDGIIHDGLAADAIRTGGIAAGGITVEGPPHEEPPHDGPSHDGPQHDRTPHDGPPHDDGPAHD